jgi:hypothetical protein
MWAVTTWRGGVEEVGDVWRSTATRSGDRGGAWAAPGGCGPVALG